MIRVNHYTEPTLNRRFLITDLGTISTDAGVLDTSVDYEPGTLIGARTEDDGLLTGWHPDAEDGSEVLVGILSDRVVAQGAGATEHRDYTARLAEVKAGLIVYPETVDPDDAALALKALNIIVRA